MNSKTVKIVVIVILVIAALIAAMALSAPKSQDTAAQSSSEADSGEAVLSAYSEGLNDDGTWTDIRALDFVTLCKYKGIEIPASELEISDEDIQEQIDAYLSKYGDVIQVKDRAVKDGDTVNIDYVGSIDGVEFDGGNTNGSGRDVTIGVTSYIDDFLEQLIGHKPGETINVEVTFPDSYPQNTDLEGKDAVFVTTINYISEDKDAELSDSFVKEKLNEETGWTSVADMKQGIEENLREVAKSNYTYTFVMENCTVSSVPDSMLEYQKNMLKSYYESYFNMYAASYDISWEEFLANCGYDSEDEIYTSYADDIENAAELGLVYQAIAEDAGITVTDEDLEYYAGEFAGDYGLETYVSAYGKPYMMNISLSGKVQDYLIDNAVIK